MAVVGSQGAYALPAGFCFPTHSINTESTDIPGIYVQHQLLMLRCLWGLCMIPFCWYWSSGQKFRKWPCLKGCRGHGLNLQGKTSSNGGITNSEMWMGFALIGDTRSTFGGCLRTPQEVCNVSKNRHFVLDLSPLGIRSSAFNTELEFWTAASLPVLLNGGSLSCVYLEKGMRLTFPGGSPRILTHHETGVPAWLRTQSFIFTQSSGSCPTAKFLISFLFCNHFRFKKSFKGNTEGFLTSSFMVLSYVTTVHFENIKASTDIWLLKSNKLCSNSTTFSTEFFFLFQDSV